MVLIHHSQLFDGYSTILTCINVKTSLDVNFVFLTYI